MTTTLVFTGSAGPGIAIAAAATALRAADAGQRTLLISLGSAVGLGTLLEAELTGEPRIVAPHLDALAIDAPAELAAAWERSRDQAPGQLPRIAGDELPLPPGLELLFGLLRLRELAPRYDMALVDAGPHDTLLRALAVPDGLRWATRLLLGLDRGPGRSPASVGRAVLPTSFMPAETLDRIQETRVVAEHARDALLTSGVTHYVLRPDEVALAEARLAVPALQLHGLAVAALLAGPLLPGGAGPRLAPLLERQRALLTDAVASWPTRPLLRFDLPLGSGLGALREIGAQLAMTQGSATLDAPAPIAEQLAGEPAIVVELPGMPKGALRITLSGDELILQVGPYRRHILLPEALRGSSIKATREGERVIVRRR
jgi:arsenite/tail-anchored protein-transporting ATPase